VTRDGKRLLAAFIAAALLAALLAACGGSDSDSSSSTEATSAGGSTASDNAQDKSRSGSQSQANGQGQGQSDSQNDQPQHRQEGGGGGSRSPEVEPLEVSGGGAEQFRTKGGDNSVQEYGDEGDESELQEVAEIVHSFYVARIEEKWDTACSYLAKSNIEQLEQLASQSPEFKDAGCGPILKAFTRPLPPAIQREITTVDAGSFRHDEEQGFLIYYGPDRTVYSMPMRNEGGGWKVGALSGSVIG
jgi:hypothetical protein